MFRSLYFKIVLIFVIFIVTVMSVVAAVLLFSVLDYYSDDFTTQMESAFDPEASMLPELISAFGSYSPTAEQKMILSSYSRQLGIDEYRNYYILSASGYVLAGSDANLGEELTLTPNILSAISGKNNNTRIAGTSYSDYALLISSDDGTQSCIIYVKDSLDEVRSLCWIMFSIIIQAFFIGLIIAVILAFFLAKAITSPIQNITEGAQHIAQGNFDYDLDVHNRDEIGTLTDTFNYMKDTLKSTIEQVDGERRKLETVFSCLRDAVLAFADDGRLLHANDSSRALLNGKLTDTFTAEDMCDCFEINLGDGEGGVEKSADSSDESYIYHDIVYDNKVFDVSLGMFKYIEDKRRRTGIIAVFHDVTSRFELDKARREFVANVSHELRTPLTSIKGACETILEDGEMEADDRLYFLNMAVSECDRMKRIIEDLLVLSRLENKRTQWQISEFSVTDTVRHICEVMRVDLDAHHHMLTLRAAKNIPLITADREKVEQVLINIVSNAVKYTPDNGKIVITAAYDGKFVRISVSDNGLGIPEQDLPHVFERFYRVEKSRTTGSGGTGLGLAIAKEIINAHGGDIEIKSVYKQGSTVTVMLPVKADLK